MNGPGKRQVLSGVALQVRQVLREKQKAAPKRLRPDEKTY
jgi:hypothetical protein